MKKAWASSLMKVIFPILVTPSTSRVDHRIASTFTTAACAFTTAACVFTTAACVFTTAECVFTTAECVLHVHLG